MRDELLTDGRGREYPIPYNAIGTFTDDIQQLVVSANGKVAYAGVGDVFHVEGDDGGTETIRCCLGTTPSPRLLLFLAPPPPGPVVTEFSVLLCTVLLSSTFSVSTTDAMPNTVMPCGCVVLKLPRIFSATLVSPHVRG